MILDEACKQSIEASGRSNLSLPYTPAVKIHRGGAVRWWTL